MSTSHVFSEIYLHINWHTKDDLPLITPAIEALVYEEISRRIQSVKGVSFLGIGGTTTHIHVGIEIEPFVCISEFVGNVKGGSSHDCNELLGSKLIQWQRGYGVVSFSKNQLTWVLAYIARQKEHHAHGSLSEKLEIFDELLEGV